MDVFHDGIFTLKVTFSSKIQEKYCNKSIIITNENNLNRFSIRMFKKLFHFK